MSAPPAATSSSSSSSSSAASKRPPLPCPHHHGKGEPLAPLDVFQAFAAEEVVARNKGEKSSSNNNSDAANTPLNLWPDKTDEAIADKATCTNPGDVVVSLFCRVQDPPKSWIFASPSTTENGTFAAPQLEKWEGIKLDADGDVISIMVRKSGGLGLHGRLNNAVMERLDVLLPKLQVLDLKNNFLEGECSLAALPPGLETLDLTSAKNTKFSEDGLRLELDVSKLPASLKILDLNSATGKMDWTALSRLKSLTVCWLGFNKFESATPFSLSHLPPGLKQFSIEHCGDFSVGTGDLSALPNSLTEFYLEGCSIQFTGYPVTFLRPNLLNLNANSVAALANIDVTVTGPTGVPNVTASGAAKVVKGDEFYGMALRAQAQRGSDPRLVLAGLVSPVPLGSRPDSWRGSLKLSAWKGVKLDEEGKAVLEITSGDAEISGGHLDSRLLHGLGEMLPELRVLSLRKHSLVSVKQQVYSLEDLPAHLEVLDLGRAAADDEDRVIFQVDTAKLPVTLRHLDLQNCRVVYRGGGDGRDWWSGLRRLTALTHLSVANCDLSGPVDIRDMSRSLSHLAIHSNSFTEVRLQLPLGLTHFTAHGIQNNNNNNSGGGGGGGGGVKIIADPTQFPLRLNALSERGMKQLEVTVVGNEDKEDSKPLRGDRFLELARSYAAAAAAALAAEIDQAPGGASNKSSSNNIKKNRKKSPAAKAPSAGNKGAAASASSPASKRPPTAPVATIKSKQQQQQQQQQKRSKSGEQQQQIAAPNRRAESQQDEGRRDSSPAAASSSSSSSAPPHRSEERDHVVAAASEFDEVVTSAAAAAAAGASERQPSSSNSNSNDLVAAIKREMKQKLSAKDAEISQLQQQKEQDLAAEKRRSEAELSKLRIEIQKLQRGLASKDEALAAKQKEMAQRDSLVARERRNKSSLEQENEAFKAELASLVATHAQAMEALAAEKEDLQDQIHLVKQQAIERMAAANERAKAAQRQMNEMEAGSFKREMQAAAFDSQKKQLTAQLAEAQRQLADLRERQVPVSWDSFTALNDGGDTNISSSSNNSNVDKKQLVADNAALQEMCDVQTKRVRELVLQLGNARRELDAKEAAAAPKQDAVVASSSSSSVAGFIVSNGAVVAPHVSSSSSSSFSLPQSQQEAASAAINNTISFTAYGPATMRPHCYCSFCAQQGGVFSQQRINNEDANAKLLPMVRATCMTCGRSFAV